MDFTHKDDPLDFEDSLYQDSSSPHGPTRARRRQSDAKWRASVATCYDTLKHVVPKGHRTATKRKVSKAVILQESERHIMHLESVLSRLIGSESQAAGKAVLWKQGSQWEKCTLKHFQDDFAEKQQRIFHSANQGRRCYNLLDEIKEEIFSMSVNPNTISVVDRDSLPVAKCVEKVNGKEVSRFSQLPLCYLGKGKDEKVLTTVNVKAADKVTTAADTSKHQKLQQQDFLEDSGGIAESYLSHEMLAGLYSDQEDQTVPSLCSTTVTSTHSRSTLDTPIASADNSATTSSSSSSSSSSSCTLSTTSRNDNSSVGFRGGYTVHVVGRSSRSSSSLTMAQLVDDCSDNQGDQEVPSFDNKACSSLHDDASAQCSVRFFDKPTRGNEEEKAASTSSAVRSFTVTDDERESKRSLKLITATPTPAQQSSASNDELEKDKTKTPANTMSIETFRSKCLDTSSNLLLRSLPDRRKDPGNKPKTARKLNFNRPECVRIHQKLSEQQSSSLGRGMSPMLAGFTPIKLSPNVSHCVTCKRPDESLISPWKPLHSPQYCDSNKKPQEKSPMIDPDNSLFCLETLDDSTLDGKESHVDHERFDTFRTPGVLSLPEATDGFKQGCKRKITCKSFDLLGKYQPKCRKKLDRFFDLGMCKALTAASGSKSASDEKVQVVPDCASSASTTVLPEEEEGDDATAAFVDLSTKMDLMSNADAIDFDGFFFYFRQIGQQLKDKQKLSRQDRLSPKHVAAKVMKMWMRLPSPDKQTIKTLAMLDNQESWSCRNLQEEVGDLSQDLQDVDVEPIDLKEFIIPTTPV